MQVRHTTWECEHNISKCASSDRCTAAPTPSTNRSLLLSSLAKPKPCRDVSLIRKTLHTQVPLKDLFVSVDGQPARVVDVPYLTRQLPKTGSSSDDDDGAAAAAAGGDAASLQDRAAAAK